MPQCSANCRDPFDFILTNSKSMKLFPKNEYGNSVAKVHCQHCQIHFHLRAHITVGPTSLQGMQRRVNKQA